MLNFFFCYVIQKKRREQAFFWFAGNPHSSLEGRSERRRA